MLDREFLTNAIYFMSGDDSGAKCAAVLGSSQWFIYPAPIDEAAAECHMNAFVRPDGRGFAINFKKVFGLYETFVTINETGYKNVICPDLNRETFSPRGYKPVCLWDIPADNGSTAVIFKDLYILIVPFTPDLVRNLRHTSLNHRDRTALPNKNQPLLGYDGPGS